MSSDFMCPLDSPNLDKGRERKRPRRDGAVELGNYRKVITKMRTHVPLSPGLMSNKYA